MVAIYIIISVFIAWIWVDYYRLIDIYEKENLVHLVATFFIGSSSIIFVLGINYFFIDKLDFALNKTFINDFLYCFLAIGMVEEFSKTIPFIIVLYAFKKHINDPIDYIAYFCIVALGFSAAENVIYFFKYGPAIINNRAIMSTVGHMFDTSLIAYGIMQFKFNKSKLGLVTIPLFFFLASLSHGFYDFWLLYDKIVGGWIVTILYFLISISWFATILNNALNISNFFSYKFVVNSDKVEGRLLSYYGIVFILQFILLLIDRNLSYALLNLKYSIYTAGFIIIVSCVRLSRFKLIKDRWYKLKLEFPFGFDYVDNFSNERNQFSMRIRIKGETYNEAYINIFYEEFFMLYPNSKILTYLAEPKLAYIERKVFLKNDETYYVTRIYSDIDQSNFELMLLKPKTKDKTMVNEKYPLVALMKINKMEDLENENSTIKNFSFKEWAFIKPQKLNSKMLK